jgi:uncharacterized protein YbaP (TraB family)
MKKSPLLVGMWAIIITFVLGASSCSGSRQAVQVDPNASYAPKEKALLWQINGKKIKKNSYLYGTIHMIEREDFFMPDYVKEAFSKSKKIIFEINPEEMNEGALIGQMMRMMFMPEGTTLKDLLGEEDYTKVKQKLNENPMVSMLGEMVDRIKPIILSALLEQGDMGADGGGSDPLGGGLLGGGMGEDITSYEGEFTIMAQEEDKPMGGLETVEFQMSMFDSIDLEDQAQMLVEALNSDGSSAEDGADMLDQMVELYKDLDVHGLYMMIHEQSSGSMDFEEQFLTMRNKNWIPLMRDMMKEQPTFFAVGAGHLGGEEGVIALLRKEGYILTPINN